MNTKMPTAIGPVHFVGIGGIGMSGIAEVLHTQGYTVRGSDMAINPNVQRLQAMGIHVEIGQRAENLADAAVVVISSAIRKDNPELAEARARGLPVVRRAEMLAEIMRFKNCVAIGGTHGKTTTTSMVAALLDAGRFDPTVINGGIINAYGTNARLGQGDWMVVEADESDGTFIKLPADVAVITNIDPEHLDHYKDFDGVKKAFRQFVDNVPFYGFAVMCLDHPTVQALVGEVEERRVITYGQNQQADVRLVDVKAERHVAVFGRHPRPGDGRADDRAAGTADARAAQYPQRNGGNRGGRPAAFRRTIFARVSRGFGGVKRRFTVRGRRRGDGDRRLRAPSGGISSVLRAARRSARRDVIAVVQPHRYSRLRDLFDEFSACFTTRTRCSWRRSMRRAAARRRDQCRIVDRIGPRASGRAGNRWAKSWPLLAERVAAGDYVVCLGAGNITAWAAALPGNWKRRWGSIRPAREVLRLAGRPLTLTPLHRERGSSRNIRRVALLLVGEGGRKRGGRMRGIDAARYVEEDSQ